MDEVFVQAVWVAADLALAAVDVLVSGPRKSTRPDAPWSRATRLTIAGLVAVLLGLVSGLVVHYRGLPGPRRAGLSLILAPVALSIVMPLAARVANPTLRAKLQHVATWYGGLIIGVGLASGRLVALQRF